MSIYLIAFLVDIVVFFVASIWLLVRAFRVSIMWGLIALFVPLGRIVFAFVHWNEGAKLLLVQLGSLGIGIALVVASPLRDELRNEHSRQSVAAAQTASAQPTPHEVRDLAANETPLPPPVDANAAQRAAYAKHAKELTTLYQQLNTERPKLRPGSPAVAAFNAKAAKYQQGLQTLADEKAHLDALDHAGNLNADAAMALAGLQAAAASEDYEAFAATLRKALAEDRGTPSFAGIVALARTTLQQATPDKVAAGLRTRAARTAKVEFDKTTRQVQAIVNQTPAVVPKPRNGAEVYHYGFHPGAGKPDFTTNNLMGTRELWKGEFVYMDDAPGVFYRSADCEFNPQTKFFYLSRNMPKKKLGDAEYQELTRLYHQLGQQEKAVTDAAPPPGATERLSADLAALKTQLDGYAMK